MMDQTIILSIIALLTFARLWYLKVHPVQRDIQEAIVPFSSRLQVADFFRRPRSRQIWESFNIVQYGVIWYAINLPIMRITNFNPRRWTYAVALVDVPFLWLSFRLGPVGALVYAGVTTFNLLKAPWNVSILWLVICAVFSWIFLILAPLAKLPIGVPVLVWGHVKGAIVYKKNPYYYGMLAVLWLFVAWRTLLPGLLADTWLGHIVSMEF